jgi:hypothetical protein
MGKIVTPQAAFGKDDGWKKLTKMGNAEIAKYLVGVVDPINLKLVGEGAKIVRDLAEKMGMDSEDVVGSAIAYFHVMVTEGLTNGLATMLVDAEGNGRVLFSIKDTAMGGSEDDTEGSATEEEV